MDSTADKKIYIDPDYNKLRALNNRIKHFDEDVREALEEGLQIQTYAIWLTETNVECRDECISYADLARIMTEHDSYVRFLASDFFQGGATKTVQSLG